MHFSDYQKKSNTFDQRESTVEGSKLMYYALGAVDETGEVFGKVKKLHRDYGGKVTAKWREALKLELGDVLWYVTQGLSYFGVSIVESVAPKNDDVDLWEEMSDLQDSTKHLFEYSVFKLRGGGAWWASKASAINGLQTAVYEIAYIGHYFGLTLEEIAAANLAKLADRAKRGTIQGEGDER